MMLTANDIKTRLANATGYPAAMYGWKNQMANVYLVVSDDGTDAFWADGKLSEEKNAGTIDLFTKDMTAKGKVETAINELDLSYYLNTVQYEEDTGYIHYEWVWECA